MKIDTVLVTTDFSETSKRAFPAATDLAGGPAEDQPPPTEGGTTPPEDATGPTIDQGTSAEEEDFEFLARSALLALDDEGFRADFRKSPLRRSRREGLLRNVCVGLGNMLEAANGVRGANGVPAADGEDDLAAVSVLQRALSDAHPLVRGHAAWALGRAMQRPATTDAARHALVRRRTSEEDEEVLVEIDAALTN